MKILFIGGTGTISSEVVILAKEKGYEVTLLNRGISSSASQVAGMELITADIHDEERVSELLKGREFDVVAQFIGFTADDVRRDIRLFSGKTKQYIYISSASAYQKPLSDYVIRESTTLFNPYWSYSRNKIAAEEVLMNEYRNNNFPVTIVRPSHTYNGKRAVVAIHGANGSWQTLKRIIEGKKVIIPGDGTSLWTLTHSKDFAKAFVGLMLNLHAKGEVFNITSDESMTWNQIYQTISETLNLPLKVLHVSSDFLANHSDNYDFRGELLGDKSNTVVFNNSKIKRVVPDFLCKVSMSEGIRQSVEYMLAHPETQIEDKEFDLWCDKIISAIEAADNCFREL